MPPLRPCRLPYLQMHHLPHLSLCFKVDVLSTPCLLFQGDCFKPVHSKQFIYFLQCLHESRDACHFCWEFTDSYQSLHLQPPKLSFLSCVLFNFVLNWFHSVKAYASSRLTALLDMLRYRIMLCVDTFIKILLLAVVMTFIKMFKKYKMSTVLYFHTLVLKNIFFF